jgi:hypothetical protein
LDYIQSIVDESWSCLKTSGSATRTRGLLLDRDILYGYLSAHGFSDSFWGNWINKTTGTPLKSRLDCNPREYHQSPMIVIHRVAFLGGGLDHVIVGGHLERRI